MASETPSNGHEPQPTPHESVQTLQAPTETVQIKSVGKDSAQVEPSQSDLEKSSPPQTLQPAQSTSASPPPPPDGGVVAWLQVLASFLMFANNVGMVNSFGVFQSVYKTTIIPDATSSQISWIGSLQPFLLMAIPVFTGPLFDKGYGRTLLITGAFFGVLGMFMTSLADKYWELVLSQGICMGIGIGLQFITATAVVPQYFAKRRSFAIGVGVGGSSIGAIIYPAVFRALLARVGFGWATRVLAFIMLGMLIVAAAVFRVRTLPPVTRKFWDSAALKSPAFLWFSLGSGFGFLALFIPFFYCVLFASHVGASESLSFYTASIMNVGSFIGRVLPAFVADKLGSFNTIIVGTSSAAVLLWSWIGVHNEPGFIAWGVLYGIASGSFASMQVACLAAIIIKERNMSYMGTWMGMNFLFSAVGAFIGGPIAGAILSDQNSWVGLQAFSAAIMTLSALCFVIARRCVNN